MSDITVKVQDSTSVDVNVSAGTAVTVSSVSTGSVGVTSKGAKGDTGEAGPQGPQGPAGDGLVSGGTENQFIQKNSATDYDTKWSAYTLPAADGADGQVLTTNGEATVTFAYPKTIAEDVKNVSGGPLLKGTPVHVTGSVGNLAEVIAADAATNYPAHFVLNEDLADDAEGLGIAIGFINNVDVPDASIYTEGQTVYLGESGGWSTTKPTGANAIQNLGIIIKVNTSGNKISGIIMGAGRANDVPNIATGNIWAGNADGVATATSVAYIDIANERVGIGTTSPVYKLDVSGSARITTDNPVLQIADSDNTIRYAALELNTLGGRWFLSSGDSNAGAGVANSDLWITRNSSGTDNRFRFYRDYNRFGIYSSGTQGVQLDADGISYFNAGNVGIGTASPVSPLHVYSNNAITGTSGGLTIEQDGTGDALLQFLLTGTKRWVVGIDNDNNDNFKISGTSDLGTDNGLTITNSTYNVGIGTTSPSEKLEIAGNVILDSSDARIKIKGGVTGTNSGIDWTFNTDATQYARIELDYDARNTTGLLIDSGYPMTLDYSSGAFSVKKNGTSELTVLNGNVGIGTTSPSAKLDVVGLANINDGSSNVMISSGNTTLTGTSNTAVGYLAGASNTSGSLNSFFGVGAGHDNTSGENNSFFGRRAGYSNASGVNNSFFGRDAGYSNTSGGNNSFFGRNAGYYSTGSSNVVIGYGAGFGSATSAYSNTVAVGYQALYDLTTGGQNTAVGHQAFTNITTGANNTAVGYQAGSANILGDSNSFFGVYAGVYTTGSANTALGHSASFSNTTGANNVAIGRSAGFSNTTGSANVLLGYEAGYGSATSAYSNTIAVGYQALRDLTTGDHNTAVGLNASDKITTGGYNVSLGNYALRSNQISSGNTALGYAAAYESTNGNNSVVGYLAGYYGNQHNATLGARALNYSTGSYNTAIGSAAAQGVYGSSTFSNTIAVGYQALTALTTGAQNTAVGYQAADSLTTEGYNTAVGNQSLGNSTGAQYTTSVGYQSLFDATDNYAVGLGYKAGYNGAFGGVYAGAFSGQYCTGDNNVLVGYAAGQGSSGASNFTYTTAVGHNSLKNLTTGHSNTGIGYQAGYNLNNGSRNVMLGYQAGYNETGSDKLYIANSNTTTPLIYGDFSLGEITINGDLNVSGGNLRADAVEINGRALTTPATGEYGAGSRLVTQFASGTVTAGKVYVANAGSWAEGDANVGSTSIGMIAVATDAASATEMLIEGVVKLSSNTGFSGAAAGTVLYLSTTAGELTTTAPSTAGEYVRVCGYVVNASTNEVFFSASRDWTAL